MPANTDIHDRAIRRKEARDTINARTVTTIVPNWKACAVIIAAALEDGTAEGKRLARIELMRMAEAADRYNEDCKG